ncbi:MAG: 23S rRNA (uracil(1939)-C(5))-methyltransferase RlmD [Mogibacterium sp.]|nr:23S rRNA (uracil(1939)-C(5))-methyltransferase RlmD [Mogibacterium sp.]
MSDNRTKIFNKDKICPQAEHCGGCKFQGMSYDEQIAEKDKSIRRLLEKHDIDESLYLGIEPAVSVLRYRNKMEYTFGDLEKGGELELGMHYRGRFMSIITTDECQLVPDDFNRVLRATLEFCRLRGYRPYHRKTHEGLLRNLVVRCGVRTNELLINIVTASSLVFDEEGFREMLLGLDLDMQIVGIMRTFNDSVADAVIDESHKLLYGRDYYNEEILGLKFKVKAFAFFQTNIEAVERLYGDVLNLVPDVSGKTVYDLYCGTGTISQLMASRAKDVYGIDIVSDSIEAARSNTELNGIENCHYICGDVKEKLDEIPQKPDVIVVDPPRAGIHDKAVKMLCSYGIDEIVYVSCNPKTLCINLDLFRELGYEIKQIKAYDNFPLTSHVETVCLLSNRKPDARVKIDVDLEDYYRIKDEQKKNKASE